MKTLTPERVERLALLMEECAEVQQSVGKILRHGYESSNPTLPEAERVSNQQLLEKELGHLRLAVDLMCGTGDIDAMAISKAVEVKRTTIMRWLHHNVVGEAKP